MSTPDFSALVARHRAYFRTGATRSTVRRVGQLTALRAMMTDRAQDFHAALWTDLRRNRTDADLTDVKFLATEAEHTLTHLRQWMKPFSVSTPPVLGPAQVQVQFDPLGVALVIGTWNYPLMLIPDLPFGGVGNSGMGKYHGEWGFRAYTNTRGVLYHGTGVDPDLRYPPYSSQKKGRELVAS